MIIIIVAIIVITGLVLGLYFGLRKSSCDGISIVQWNIEWEACTDTEKFNNQFAKWKDMDFITTQECSEDLTNFKKVTCQIDKDQLTIYYNTKWTLTSKGECVSLGNDLDPDRLATIATFQGPDQTVNVINVHLPHIGAEENVMSGLSKLTIPSADLTIMAGDFNREQTDSTFKEIQSKFNLQTSSGGKTCCTDNGFSVEYDHILATKPISISVNKSNLSDHKPVIGCIRF